MRDRDFLFGFVSLFPRSLVSWWGRDFCSFGFSMSGILLTGTRVFWPSRWRRRHLVRCSRHPLIRNDTLMINRYQSISIQTYTRSMTAEVQDEPPAPNSAEFSRFDLTWRKRKCKRKPRIRGSRRIEDTGNHIDSDLQY